MLTGRAGDGGSISTRLTCSKGQVSQAGAAGCFSSRVYMAGQATCWRHLLAHTSRLWSAIKNGLQVDFLKVAQVEAAQQCRQDGALHAVPGNS